jgi:hypothetical protein
MSGFYVSNGLHRRLGYEPEQKRPSDLLGEIDNEPRLLCCFVEAGMRERDTNRSWSKLWRGGGKQGSCLAFVRMTVQARTDISGLVPESRMRNFSGAS